MRPIRRYVATFLIAPLFAVAPMRAQQIIDQHATTLEWEFLQMVVFPDPDAGVFVWVAWRGTEDAEPDFVGRYDPSQLSTWVERARAMLTARRPERDDTTTVLKSGTVNDVDEGGMYLLRYRDENEWESGTVLVLRAAPSASPMAIELDSEGTVSFLDALERSLSPTGLDPQGGGPVRHANPANPTSLPRPDPSNPAVAYPEELGPQGVTGDVWITYVIDETGTPEWRSLRVLLSEHDLLSEAMTDVLQRSRFTVTRRRGQPARVQMFVRHSFDGPG